MEDDIELKKIKRLLSNTKNRAKNNGIPFLLKLEDLLDEEGKPPKYCPIMKHRLDYEAEGSANLQSASIERLCPDVGYIAKNCLLVSMSAQWVKSNHSIHKLVEIANEFEQVYFDKYFGDRK